MASEQLVGMEVPIIGSDSVKWIEVSVPVSAAPAQGSRSTAPLTEDAASCSVIGDPPTYLFQRIRKQLPHALEILEVSADKEFPRVGLRLLFTEPLSPFAYICKNEISPSSGNPYLVYALSCSGIGYLFQVKNISSYASLSIFSSTDFLHCDTQISPDYGCITAATAAAGSLVIGREDGSLSCYHLGAIDQNAPGFMYELRDEATFSRLWGFMSRGRTSGSVKDLVISEIKGRKVVFVLHSEGTVHGWDLLGRGKIFSQAVGSPGNTFSRLWVGLADPATSMIPLAVLFSENSEASMQGINIYSLNFTSRDRLNLLESSMQYIPLSEGKVIDVKLSSNKIWILKEDGLLAQDLVSVSYDVGEGQCYALHESFVAEQLFQSSEQSFDDLYQTTCSIFSSVEAPTIAFVSSIFLHKIFHPGVHNRNVLRATFEEYNKQWTDHEFQALTVDGLRREILSLIEHEAIPGSPFSAFKCWRNFCSRYFDKWRMRNAPFGLLVDSLSGAVGLIRENSVSLFRCLEDIELLSCVGIFDGLEDQYKFGLDVSDDGLGREILCDVLRCSTSLSQRLGQAVSSIFSESIISQSIISSEDIVPLLLKTLESGCNSSILSLCVLELGVDTVREKELAEHRNLRKFSIDMLIAINALYNKAGGWGRVLDVVNSYLNFLVPRKIIPKLDSDMTFNMNPSVIVQATGQVAKVMFDSALEVLLLLSYLVNISGQIHMLQDDKSRVQLELIPMIHEIVVEWFIIHFLCVTPSESPVVDDFSSKLSSLTIDSSVGKRSWTEKLGSIDFTLAFVLLLNAEASFEGSNGQSSVSLPNPQSLVSSVRNFTSWIIWGRGGEKSSYTFSQLTEPASILLRQGQHNAVENLLMIVEAYLKNENLSGSIQNADGEWCILQHLLGCCLLAQARGEIHEPTAGRKIGEAVRCFFRASSGEGAVHVLQNLPSEMGLPHLAGRVSAAVWKLHYYQWVMQKFEQYSVSEAACQFALAALELADEAVMRDGDGDGDGDGDYEPAITIRGRLWANVFKFTLDLNLYYDAYCAIVSNPDVESKYICLRRFIIVLCERGATKVLCNGHLPFIGLTEKVEQELAWKAARSDISTRPNPYKLLYTFEMHRQNWRKAAGYMYLYSTQLKSEMASGNYQNVSLALQERLNGVAATINALHLVHPMYAWVDLYIGGNQSDTQLHPIKKARTVELQSNSDVQTRKPQCYIDIEKLEDEFVVTSAEYVLSLENVRWNNTGHEASLSGLVNLLIETNLYDMAFTVVLRFWKGSGLKRELERVLSAMALKCCPGKVSSPMFGKHGLLLTSSGDEVKMDGVLDMDPQSSQLKGSQWEVLEKYVEKYERFHGRLPVVVAETLLRSDPQIELPLWLVRMFKGERKGSWGMTGRESDPASLLRLYVDYGRYAEATDLLLEYINAYASVRPADIIHRKRPFAAWFPYTAIERLWCQLKESIHVGHMTGQCEKLKALLHEALRSHLILLKGDSKDAISSAT